MPDLPRETPKILSIYLQIAQYPILASAIRQRMREELFRRGVITPAHLEHEAHEKAISSQRREGLTDPLVEEASAQWEERLRLIRDHLTDFYFAYNLPLDLFTTIVEHVLAERAPGAEGGITFNPELAPRELLQQQMADYEKLPPEERMRVAHHLEEMRVVLTKTMVSDQLGFVRVAKQWFGAQDFASIQAHCVGGGKIGGKAGGLLLGWNILQGTAPHLASRLRLPRSYFVGADVFYDFLALNGLEYLNQKYKTAEQIADEYPAIVTTYAAARFPEAALDGLRTVLAELGPAPLIVRSSSLLEDSFGTSFAGKYASYFCANQGSLEENLETLTAAIRRIYASVYNPDVLIYRRRMGLLDYDERMAILLQEVQGERYGESLFPALAGVAFSTSPIVWDAQMRPEEGFVRLVLGLGTRAVERVGEDYPRLIMLSHPRLRPETSPGAIRRYSQSAVDLIDLAANAFVTRPVHEVLGVDYPGLTWVASLDSGDTILPLFSLGPEVTPRNLVLTFDNLISRTSFVPLIKEILGTLARTLGGPVDVEFAVTKLGRGGEGFVLHLLQCRPQSNLREAGATPIPEGLREEDMLLRATRMVPRGQVDQIEYLVYVPPQAYRSIAEDGQRGEVARLIGRINTRLAGRRFVLLGPGRWGSSNPRLGVPVGYADIYNASALVELAAGPEGARPDPSFGTHFFQDLFEAQIYPLAIDSANEEDWLNVHFLDGSTNVLGEIVPDSLGLSELVRVISVAQARPGATLTLTMDGAKAVAYFAPSG
jgi:Pyruvate phosphate dikinase, AMP/ATP-binding domain